MRRIVLEEPLSRAAVWSRGCAVFAMTVAVVGIVMARKGLDPTAAVAVEGGAMAMALLAILFALAAVVVIWRTGYRGTGRVVVGLVLAMLVLAYPAYLAAEARGASRLGDVSTDLVDPPSFSLAPRALAERGGKTPPPPAPADQEALRRLYPDLQSIVLDREALDTQKVIAKLVAARRWRIVDETLPSGQFGIGHIDAIALSTVMGFPADVTIRVKPLGGQTKIDIRSVSRTPWHTPTSDVTRVESLAADIDDALSDDK
jgi:hypothetical protein